VQHVFKSEQAEYEEEEIDWSYIDFIDNADVLDLIEKVRILGCSFQGWDVHFPTPISESSGLDLRVDGYTSQ